ncbi:MULTISPECIES: hypothetical protein [unclassified Serratia (in: enterobacteria)]|uniref:hypothetical protein n=1 Tax=unclassified Serratia (in: enterobacteria) TaxID=2647522 RepID=UPI00068DA6A6|nr:MULTISPECIES: hypothetical protein [unclassified Serratia (in: enterobacteria)]
MERITVGKTKKNIVSRVNPPIFPLSIRMGISDDICIVDFMDSPEKDVVNVFYSIALTKNHAERLISGLTKFIEMED